MQIAFCIAKEQQIAISLLAADFGSIYLSRCYANWSIGPICAIINLTFFPCGARRIFGNRHIGKRIDDEPERFRLERRHGINDIFYPFKRRGICQLQRRTYQLAITFERRLFFHRRPDKPGIAEYSGYTKYI